MKIAIFGLGYVGFTAACCIAQDGHEVIGVDVSSAKVDMINGGKAPISEPGLQEMLTEALASGRIRAITNCEGELEGVDLILVCVGTPSAADGAHDMRYIAEVSRNVVRSLGVNLASIDSTQGFKFGVGQGRGPTTFSPGRSLGANAGAITDSVLNPVTGAITEEPGTALATNSIGTTLGFAGQLLGLDLSAAIDLAETHNLAVTLSQPNLTALSGETAEFLAGGEFPIPLSQGFGTTTVEYKNYGVSLSYTPTVLANGRISLRVRPEVSELTSQGSVTLNGFRVPGLITRRTETTIELGSGQSMMIAGLLSNSSQNAIEKAPGLGDVPILGNLFRSTNFQRGETELVIVVTPYLVKPMNASDVRLPTDGYLKPTEGQRLLQYRDSDGVTGGARPGPAAVPAAPANPAISRTMEAEPVLAQSYDPRNREKSASAKPGFSFK